LAQRCGHRSAGSCGFREKVLSVLSQAAFALWQVVVLPAAEHDIDTFSHLLRGNELLSVADEIITMKTF
jgi:hypothetical protein